MAILLDGKAMAQELAEGLKQRISALKSRGVTPGLAVILVGEDPASQVYVRNKGKACGELGIYSETLRLPENTSQEELEAVIDRLNRDEHIDGILVQLPLPGHLDEAAALRKIIPEKDVDGFHVENAGRLFAGQAGVVPCTPKGILHMLRAAHVPMEGKEAVVIGRSNIVGKPVAMLLLQENCTVTLCHSRTADLAAHTRRADILVAAVGKPRFVTADMVKPGAAVIDVGINRVDGKVVGDVDFEQVEKVAGYLSPVPGGVGKMTIGMLMENTVEAAERKAE
ncbi:MAG: bifunctional methylenetetrahydrofolate dehydrogenase/methenyltetrahydrofolate cyclohydrolase FolD [Clostridiales bacterium]|nr:bifunctional methylenetetrahydrofolate dehydrogenase/methenyltetrahydrofolate cyclohydrolase FolD [Clostridiales bacterium]